MDSDSNPIRLLLAGASGAVGREVLALALAEPRVAAVVAPTRRPLPAADKLLNPVVDFTQLPEDAEWWSVDAVICALGSTIKQAGSQAAFAFVDRDLPLRIAALARAAGAGCYALNSALGASRRGNFYLRTKAEAEAAIGVLGFPSYTIVRPSLIEAEREQPRRGELAGVALARVLGPLIPRRYRPVKAARIAQALLAAVLAAPAGQQIIESERLQD